MPAAGATLVWSAAALALYPAASASLWTLTPVVFLIGCGCGLATILQTRLMGVAEDAQTLAAALCRTRNRRQASALRNHASVAKSARTSTACELLTPCRPSSLPAETSAWSGEADL
jgi:hypothetical protein